MDFLKRYFAGLKAFYAVLGRTKPAEAVRLRCVLVVSRECIYRIYISVDTRICLESHADRVHGERISESANTDPDTPTAPLGLTLTAVARVARVARA